MKSVLITVFSFSFYTNLVLSLIFMTALSESALYGDQATKERILREVPIAWNNLLKREDSLIYEKDETIVVKKDPPQITTNTYSYILLRECSLRSELLGNQENQNKKGSQGIILGAVNQHYRFVLSAYNESSPKWRVSKLEKIEEGSNIASFPDLNLTGSPLYEAQSAYCSRFPGLNTFFCFLPSMFAAQGFELKDAESLEEDGMKLVKIHYSYEPPFPKSNNIVRGGELYLMEDYDWMIKRGKFECFERGVQKRPIVFIKNTYDFKNTPHPLLLNTELTSTGSQYGDGVNTASYRWKNSDEINKEIFSLTYYGLPEPDFTIRQNHFHLFRSLLVVTGAMMIIFSMYRIYKRKKRNGTVSA